MFKNFIILSSIFKRVAVSALAISWLLMPVNAQEKDVYSSDWVKSEYGAVRIVSGLSRVAGNKELGLGLEFKLPTGWKIYHENSGDAGLPPEFENKNSQNVILNTWVYPKPIAFEFAGIRTVGYKDAVILPWTVGVIDTTKDVVIDGAVQYLSCNQTCVPVKADLQLTIKAGDGVTTPHFRNIAKYASSAGWLPDDVRLDSNANATDNTNIWLMVAIAILGGFILNAMPCVLPVLSLKTISIVNTVQLDKKGVRIEMLFMALGIVFTFVVMGIILAILKASGLRLGWGIQFQDPLFLSFMMGIMIVLTANMFGVFHFRTPTLPHTLTFLHTKGAKAFYNGVLATLLATPCSAPFLGTAVGFALGGSVWQILTIFVSLGFGMALPYITLGAFPAWSHYIPKAGRWTVILKNIMGGFMGLTVVFLGWILSLSIGLEQTFMIGIMAGAIVLMVSMKPNGRIYKVRYVLAGLLVVGIFYISTNNTNKTFDDRGAVWQDFKPKEIQSLIDDGKVVFVDITASWCITCKVNKAVALDVDTVQSLLKSDKVFAMQGDWTHPDATITEFLLKYKRYGIPFDIVYSQSYPNGIVLPEILTPFRVINAIKKAQ